MILENWARLRLRNVATMLVSNVDKHIHDGEHPVRLCNYVDVYKHERITDKISFMRATATHEEIEKFRIRVGDVIITKDSEDWKDIGVPSLVEHEADDLVCGYHLAILRPLSDVLSGEYLLRALQSREVAQQFQIQANGITRYSLPHEAIKSVLIPVPPPERQKAIIRFLDWAIGCLERAIHAKRKMIALLNEQKQAIIQRAVTRGIEPDVRLRPSGRNWLGDIPDRWEVIRIKNLLREIDIRSTTGTETLLSMRMYHGLVPFAEHYSRPPQAATLVGFKKVAPGDFVVNRMQAGNGLIFAAHTSGLVSPDYGVFRPIGKFNAEYLGELLRTKTMRAKFRSESKGLGTGTSGFLRLYNDRFGAIHITLPPIAEQSQIMAHCHHRVAGINQAMARENQELSLLGEYRVRLTSDVVAGELDIHVDLPTDGISDQADRSVDIKVGLEEAADVAADEEEYEHADD